jgi:transcriptional regulator with XRE-family HTH domain
MEMTLRKDPDAPMELIPGQCRAARALLFWSQERLARASGLGISTVYDFERDRRNVSADAVRSIRLALENAGIVLNDNGGVKLRKPKEKPTK